MNRRTAALILVVLFLLILASPLAWARMVSVRCGAEMTGKVWPDGTELLLPKDAVLFIDKPVKWAGRLTVVGNGAWIKNRQGPFAPTFNAGPGQTLRIYNATLAQSTMLTLSGWKYNRGVTQWPGSHVELRNVFVADGQGWQIEGGSSSTWIGGGTSPKSTTYAYAMYAGNNLGGTFADRVYVEGCSFRVGRKETGVRIMGAAAQFVRCTFTADTAEGKAHGKPAVQPRHGDVAFVDCTIINSIDAGGLAPSIDAGRHSAYGAKHPATIRIEGGTLRGWVQVAGNTTLVTRNLRVLGRDTRGSGGDACFNLITHKWGTVTLRPQGASYATAVNCFKQFAASGWRIVESTLNGAPAK